MPLEEIKLGRIGHYYIPGAGEAGSCETAIIAKVWSPSMVNVVCWQQIDGDQDFHSSVPVVGMGEPQPPSASFHLNRACPFDR